MSDKRVNPRTPANTFGQTENKSLESEQTEEKSGDEAVVTDPEPTTAGRVADVEAPDLSADEADKSTDAEPETVSVKMLHHGEFEGEPLIPGETYDLPKRLADSLVTGFRAVTA